MFDKLFERRAARKDPRFKSFVEAKKYYEQFLYGSRVRFDQMGEADYQRALNDQRVLSARYGFSEAAAMSKNEGVLVDEAVARYQLGMVCHACGELEESGNHMRAALSILQNLTIEDQSAVKSGCHYHLGVIAQKQNNSDEAIRHLLESRRLDEALMDFSGIQTCDAALEKCDYTESDEASSVEITDIQDHTAGQTRSEQWEIPESETSYVSENSADPADDKIFAKPTRVRYNQSQVIWLASYSVKANDRIMQHLEMLGDAFGRPATISRVAFGADNEEQASLSEPDQGQHLCAAILVLERAGIGDKGLQELAVLCIERVLARPDFRLLVYLDDLSVDDLRDMEESEPFIKTLFDTTQIAELPSLEQLRNTLVPFVRRVERIQATEWWRQFRLRAARVSGVIATCILLIIAAMSLLGFPVWLLNLRLDTYVPYAREWSALVPGLLAFPVQAPFIFIILRGLRKTSTAPRDNKSFIPWAIVGGVILVGATRLQYHLEGPTAWTLLGLFFGVILDALRRAGYQARREMIDITAYCRAISKSSENEHPEIRLQEEPFNPFTCPILPSLSTKIFISYSRSSGKGSKIARALYGRLKQAGASPFLDRASIPVGTSWRRSLNQHVGECDVFICLLDNKSVQREWVAAELIAAIEGRKITSAPHIIVLADPEILKLPSGTKPVFQAIMDAEKESGVSTRPQIVYVNNQTLESVTWDLQPGRFASTAVFPRFGAMIVMSVLALFGFIGGLGMIMGVVLGVFAVLEKWTSLSFSAWIVSHDVLIPTVLLSGLWLGWTARTAITWGFEDYFYRQEGVVPCIIATLGLAFVLIVLIPETSIYVAAWSAALTIAGWMAMASLVHSGIARKRKH